MMTDPTSERLEAFVFTLGLDCPHCGDLLPVNGPRRSEKCENCLRESTLTPTRWAEQIAAAAQGSQILGHAYTARPVGGSTLPCPRCGDGVQIDLPGGGQPVAACTCGAALPVVEPPDWLREVFPSVRYVAGVEVEAERTGTALEDRAEEERPVVLECPSCGASLSVTSDSERTTPCEHCRANVFLPDALWRVLHPAKTVEPWAIVYTGTRLLTGEEIERRRREEAEARRRAEAEKQRREAEVRAERAAAAERRRASRRRVPMLAAGAALGHVGIGAAILSTIFSDELTTVADNLVPALFLGGLVAATAGVIVFLIGTGALK